MRLSRGGGEETAEPQTGRASPIRTRIRSERDGGPCESCLRRKDVSCNEREDLRKKEGKGEKGNWQGASLQRMTRERKKFVKKMSETPFMFQKQKEMSGQKRNAYRLQKSCLPRRREIQYQRPRSILGGKTLLEGHQGRVRSSQRGVAVEPKALRQKARRPRTDDTPIGSGFERKKLRFTALKRVDGSLKRDQAESEKVSRPGGGRN